MPGIGSDGLVSSGSASAKRQPIRRRGRCREKKQQPLPRRTDLTKCKLRRTSLLQFVADHASVTQDYLSLRPHREFDVVCHNTMSQHVFVKVGLSSKMCWPFFESRFPVVRRREGSWFVGNARAIATRCVLRRKAPKIMMSTVVRPTSSINCVARSLALNFHNLERYQDVFESGEVGIR